MAALATAVGLGIAASGANVGLRVFSALYVAGLWFDTWRRLRHRLIYNSGGLDVRHGTFRRTTFDWDDIADVRVGWSDEHRQHR